MRTQVLDIARQSTPTGVLPARLRIDTGRLNMIVPLFTRAVGVTSGRLTEPLGYVPGLAALIRSSLPGVNGLRLVFSADWFEDGDLAPRVEEFLTEWAASGAGILWCYGSDFMNLRISGTVEAQVADLSGPVQAHIAASFAALRDWLASRPTLMAASVGVEIMNEPAIYQHYRGDAGAARPAGYFEHLYAEHITRHARDISTWWDGHIYVGGFGYSGRFTDFQMLDAEGVSALQRIRAGVGLDRLVWSWHWYPITNISTVNRASDLRGRWRKNLAPLGQDRVVMTETNVSGTDIGDPTTDRTLAGTILSALDWLYHRGVGTGYFPPLNSGSSSLLVVDGATGQVRVQHPHGLAAAVALWRADGEAATGDSTLPVQVIADYNDPLAPQGTVVAASLALRLGAEGADTMTGDPNKASMLFGGAGADSLTGAAGGRSWLYGEDGADTLTAGGAFDQVHAGSGDDVIILRGDHAIASGGDGSDVIRIERGSAVVSGGGGADLFIAAAPTGKTTRIVDFDATRDTLDLSGWPRDTPTTITQIGTGVEVKSGGEVIVLDRTAVSAVTPRIIHAPLDPLAGLYGTGLGKIPLRLSPVDALLDASGHVISLPNRGGAGPYFDAPVATGTITRTGKFLALKSSFLTLANPADLIGVRAFAVVASAQTTGNHQLLGRSGGLVAGERTGVTWQAGNARFALDRYDGSTYVGTSGYFAVQITTTPSLVEIEVLPGTARLWQNGVLKGSVTHNFPDFKIDRIGSGRTAASYEGSLDGPISLITDGTAAYDGAVATVRQYLASKHGITLG